MAFDDAIQDARRAADQQADAEERRRQQRAAEHARAAAELRREAVARLQPLISEALIKVEPSKWYKLGDRFEDTSRNFYRATSRQRSWVLADIQKELAKSDAYRPEPVLLLEDTTIGFFQPGPELERLTPLPPELRNRREFVSSHPLNTASASYTSYLRSDTGNSFLDALEQRLAETVVRYERDARTLAPGQ